MQIQGDKTRYNNDADNDENVLLKLLLDDYLLENAKIRPNTFTKTFHRNLFLLLEQHFSRDILGKPVYYDKILH